MLVVVVFERFGMATQRVHDIVSCRSTRGRKVTYMNSDVAKKTGAELSDETLDAVVGGHIGSEVIKDVGNVVKDSLELAGKVESAVLGKAEGVVRAGLDLAEN